MHQATPDMAQERVLEILEQSRGKDTLGAIVTKLTNAVPVEQKSLDLLNEFREKRNWLVHHIEIQSGLDSYDPDVLRSLMKRLDDLQLRAQHLNAEFINLVLKFAQSRGVTLEQIDAKVIQDFGPKVKPVR